MKPALSLLRLIVLVTMGMVVNAAFSGMATAQITPADGVVYVTPGGTGNGSSWHDATSDLHNAIHSGAASVFVAVGNYNVGDHSFVMKQGVAIYGGFNPAGGITDLTHNRILPTTGGNGSVLNGQNVRPVIYNIYSFETRIGDATIDGFTITGGYSNGDGGGMVNQYASITIRNCVFSGNKARGGGAIAEAFWAATYVNDCIFKNNEAEDGGAIHSELGVYPRFTNCIFKANKATRYGGAIANYRDSFVRLYGCTVEGNRADELGGAIYTSGSSYELQTSDFTSNTAKNGGALYNLSTSSSPQIKDCNFTGNQAEGDLSSGRGGAIYNDGSNTTLARCNMTDNMAVRGGGIYNQSSSPSVSRCTFTGNQSLDLGGGMYNIGNSHPVISYCAFSGNIGASGGGIANVEGASRLINSVFYSNASFFNGGAMHNGLTSPTICNSLFIGNTAQLGSGGAIYNTPDNTNLTVRNSIIIGNSAGNSNGVYHLGSTSSVTHSMVQGFPTGPDDNISGEGNDPSFLDPANPVGPDGIWGTADDGFRLTSSSILRNVGSNAAYEEADGNNGNNSLQNDTDFTGRPRLAYGTIDIGPYEFELFPDGNKIIYVKTVATGAATGESWDDATNDLQGAIHARGAEMVFVAKGAYTANTQSFVMKNGVAVYGGFDPEGNITDLGHSRIMPGSSNPASVLSGNNERPVIINDFTAADPLTTSAVLDGFMLTGGYSAAEGGAMFNHNASPLLRNLKITGNTGAAALYNNASAPVLTNVSITGNNGIGIYQISHTDPAILTNVTLAGNLGSAFSALAPLTLYNSIAYGGVSGTYAAHYSLIHNSSNINNHNVNGWLVAPEEVFTNPSAGDYTLLNTSPAINKGNDALFPDLDAQSRDLAGNPRVNNYGNRGRIDLGAFESPYKTPVRQDANGIVYVRLDHNGNGGSWEDAICYLQDAIDADGPHRVFVASGIYGVGAHSFTMKNNVEIYGGFDPENGITELSHDRIMPDPANNAGSVLDGEGQRPVIWNMFDSEANGIGRSAVLDGFTITNGLYAAGSGIRNWYASPRLNNLVIRHNKATSSGAGIYNNLDSNPLITNTVIHSNEVEGTNISGAGIYNSDGSAPEIINVTIAGNKLITTGSAKGAGMYSYNASAKVYNSIFRNNLKMSSADVPGADIENEWADITLKNSITQVYPVGNSEDNNKVGADPLFTNEAAGDYTLRSGSPAINTGSNSLYPDQDAGPRDLAANPRLTGGTIDMGAYENPDGALPVRWISFEGYLTEQRQAVLTWKTEETNVSHYEVERSVNAKDFQVIGTVTAGATGSAHYSHTDPAPVFGRAYYRIRQIDFDGTFSYSRMISLASEGNNELFAYPNPMHDRATVELGTTYIGSTVSLVNSAGITLEQLEVKQATLNLDMQKYAPGIYLLRTSDGKVLKLIRE